MEIKNIPEFAVYCQEHADDSQLQDAVSYANELADLSEGLHIQFGDHVSAGMDELIEDAYQRLYVRGVRPRDSRQLSQTHEVLTRFWKHGEAFDRWFQTKVIIVQQQA